MTNFKLQSHWPYLKVRNIIRTRELSVQDGNHGEIHPKAEDYVDEGIPFVMANDIRNGKIDLLNCKFITEERANKLRIGFSRPGDLLLTHKGTVGEVAIVPEIKKSFIMLTPQVTYYRINTLRISSKYLYYYFQSHEFKTQLDLISGTQSTRAYIGILAQRNLSIPTPTIQIQSRIHSYLDKKCEQIDLAINKKNELLEKLYEELANTITLTITGCREQEDIGRETKSEWVRHIPSSWECKRLKYVAAINPSQLTDSTPEDYLIRYIDIGNVGTGELKEEPIQLTFKDAPSRARRKVEYGDTIISTVRTYLKAIIQITDKETADLIVSTGFAVIRANKKLVDPEYLYYFLLSDFSIQWITSISRGVSYPAINATDLGSAQIFYPRDINKQKKLVVEIKKEKARIEKLKDKIHEEIRLLSEYKTTLITEAVTGKLDLSTTNG